MPDKYCMYLCMYLFICFLISLYITVQGVNLSTVLGCRMTASHGHTGIVSEGPECNASLVICIRMFIHHRLCSKLCKRIKVGKTPQTYWQRLNQTSRTLKGSLFLSCLSKFVLQSRKKKHFSVKSE